MKKMFEGSAVASAILLIVIAALGFLFNVKNQKNKSKERRRSERHIEKAQKKKDIHYSQQIRKIEREKKKNDDELEQYKKLNDPLWHYYDIEEDEYRTLPGKYGLDKPPPIPRDY